jgi:PelA/Pel-15E family pectate lyase
MSTTSCKYDWIIAVELALMKKIVFISLIIFSCFILPIDSILVAQTNNLKLDVEQAMLSATKYMVKDVSTNGGYVRKYLPNLSRRWGELEAFKTQIWLQGPGGTIDMGNLFLDAYNATGNEYYYKAAEKVAYALIWGQLPSGGWNYFINFAGKRSTKKWYNTIGKNAWGFEEFYHYYGNATFDDGVSAAAASFLLRIYIQKLDPKFKSPLNKAIKFILKSQYPLGGWPQRYPLKYSYPHTYSEDYTSFYTFNDGVIQNNIGFLIKCYVLLGRKRFLQPILRGMNFYLITQQGNPQGGWGQQYNMKLEPAHARTQEPAALAPEYTFDNVKLLLKFYRYTGDRKYLARIPDAIKWLKSTRLKNKTDKGEEDTFPFYVQIGTNRAIFVHRSGSNVRNGRYWWDYKGKNVLWGKPHLNIKKLEKKYKRVSALSDKEATINSPLKVGKFLKGKTPQEYYRLHPYFPSIMNLELLSTQNPKAADKAEVKKIISSLDNQNRWLIKHTWISPPYSIKNGEPTNTSLLETTDGEAIVDSTNQQYISTKRYIRNMEILISYINQSKNR